MTPGARVEAAIELLDAIIAAARDQGAAADTLIARYFAARRYAGSKDRRAVRELVYAAIRQAGERPANGRAAMVALADQDAGLAALFTGEGHAPAPIGTHEPRAAWGAAPIWMLPLLQASGLGEIDLAALTERAPLDIRVNRLKAQRQAVLAQIEGAEPLVHTADGLRLRSGTVVEKLAPFADGMIEVQDEGSQIVAAAAHAAPGMTVVDLCAGAGGKTLALGAAMHNEGRLIACDIDRARLSRLAPRAERAGLTIVEPLLLNPKHEAEMLAPLVAAADVVMVDAPCSGMGTWRRNPEARWRLTAERLDRLAATQRMLIDLAAELVRPGGALVYIVCSLLDQEGPDQAARFLDAHPGWRAEPAAQGVGAARGAGLRLTPARDGTDGFFVARLVRPC